MNLPVFSPLMTFTLFACFIAGSSSDISKQKESEKISLTGKLLQKQGEPLMLLWGGERPPSLGGRTCWKTTRDAQGFGASVQHTVEVVWHGVPAPYGGGSKTETAQVNLKWNEKGGEATLTVEPLGHNELGNLIKGEYRILFADEWCTIIRPKTGTQVCTVWVPASTTGFSHRKCRTAFKGFCSNGQECV